MTMSGEGPEVLHELQYEVEAELRLVESGGADEASALSQADWLFDPSDIERYRICLHGLLGAVTALERARELVRAIDET
jgi:hypothetical protein